MLGSHWLAYLLAAPDGHARAHLLEMTGHGYWPIAIALGIAGFAAGLFGVVARTLGGDPALTSSKARLFASAFPRTLALQVGGFAALEILERVLVGHSIGLTTLLEPTFVIGLALQLLAALVTALLLVGVAYAVELLVALVTAPTATATLPIPLISLIPAPRLVPATGGLTLRGPPFLR